MRNKLIFILLILFSLVFIACDNNVDPNGEEQKELTAFEKVQEAKAKLEIGDVNNVIANIALPKLGEHEVEIVWESSNPQVLSNKGVINRPTDQDAVVNLVAKLSFGATTDTKLFIVTIKAIPQDVMGKLNEAKENFVLYPKETVNSDTIVLPRVADLHLIYLL